MGAQHIRSYTRQLFEPIYSGTGDQLIAYDPACSTGRFLSEFAEINRSRIRTIGQDLSEQMVGYAAPHFDEVHYGDAIDPTVGPGEVEVLFARFLNSEVVTTEQARELLAPLVSTVIPDGTVVLFGHTPVLLDINDLVDVGLRVDQTTARQDNHVFQYYVCTR